MSKISAKDTARNNYNAQTKPLYDALEAIREPAQIIFDLAVQDAENVWRNTIMPAEEAFEKAKKPLYDAYYKIVDDIQNGVCPLCHDKEDNNV